MGKLTKAQRDTLVKKIQEAKIGLILTTISCILGFSVCFLIWLQGKYSAQTKLFWAMLIIGILGLGFSLNAEGELKKKQAQLDEDRE